MRRHHWWWKGVVILALSLSACESMIDAPVTPTVAPTHTPDETAIALRASATPSPTFTASFTPTESATPTASVTATDTATPSVTPTFTATSTGTVTPSPTPSVTDTATATATPTRTPTRTATPTHTVTPRPTITPLPTATATAPPSATPTATASATATLPPTTTASHTPSVTFTPRPSATPTLTPTASATLRPLEAYTFTPWPSATPDQAGTPAILLPTDTPPPAGPATFTPFPTQTPSFDQPPQAMPSPTPRPPIVSPPPTEGLDSGEPDFSLGATPTPAPGVPGAFFDPGAEDTAPEAPIAPPAAPGEAEVGGPPLPEQSGVIVSYAGQVVPLLTLTGGLEAAPLAQGDIFDVARTGVVAAISGAPGGQSSLRIGGQELLASPSSEFGLNTNLRYEDVAWSPDGSRLAFRIDAHNPDDPTAISSGVWVYRPGDDTAHQVFRTGLEGQVAQQHEQRRPTTVTWSPDGSALIIRVTTLRGFANVVTPTSHDVNLAPDGGYIESLPFADATWAANGRDVIVSGAPWGGGPDVVGRANPATGAYEEYLSQQATGLFMRAAFEAEPGWIAFLGGPSPDGFALYLAPAAPGSTPSPVSGTIPGQVQHAEWSRERDAALVTVQSPTGPRLWIVRLDGTTQDVTPPSGVFTDAGWE